MEKTPWPIELNLHPGFKREQQDDNVATIDYSEKKFEPKEVERITTEFFERPEEFREMILKYIHIESKEKFNDGSVFYLWLTKNCPVGCEFCFFNSPKNAEKSNENEITEEGINKIVKFSEDAKLEKFVISGGGEPMMNPKKTNELVRRIKSELLVLVSSGFWAKTETGTNKCLSELLTSSTENPNQPTTVIRLSLDSWHFEKLSKDKSFDYVNNIINWFSKNALDNPKFKLLIHTMEGDKTTSDLLSQLQVNTCDTKGDYLKRLTEVKIKDGLNFNIEYSQIFDINLKLDLNNKKEEIANNVKTFRDFIEYRRNGNMSVQFHDKNSKGVYFLTLYDGSTSIWGATAPDVESSIYKDNYKEILEKNRNDILTLATLEKGHCYVQDVVSEVNPIAVSRAIGSGERDFYTRLLWEEDTTRLYSSIRLIQKYIDDGRVDKETMDKWPTKLRAVISLDKEKLKSICLDSSYTIVHQYLADPNISVEGLISLYQLVTLGHYVVTPEKMSKIIEDSNIDSKMKEAFIKNISI